MFPVIGENVNISSEFANLTATAVVVVPKSIAMTLYLLSLDIIEGGCGAFLENSYMAMNKI